MPKFRLKIGIVHSVKRLATKVPSTTKMPSPTPMKRLATKAPVRPIPPVMKTPNTTRATPKIPTGPHEIKPPMVSAKRLAKKLPANPTKRAAKKVRY